MEMQLIRENMETEQVVFARPAQVTVEAEAALPGGLREEARVYYADAAAAVEYVLRGGEFADFEKPVTAAAALAEGDTVAIASANA